MGGERDAPVWLAVAFGVASLRVALQEVGNFFKSIPLSWLLIIAQPSATERVRLAESSSYQGQMFPLGLALKESGQRQQFVVSGKLS